MFDTVIVSQHAAPSPDGTLIASVFQNQLLLRATSDGSVTETFDLPRTENNVYRWLRWSKSSSPNRHEPLRILLGNDDAICVFETRNPGWKATIHGSSANLGKILDLDFGANENEIVVFSDFGLKVTIWSLMSSRGVEIKDPKLGSKCHAYRPVTRHFALLTRQVAHDRLLILAPNTHNILENVELQTVDAQGIRWSPDGRWLAIWETGSIGYRTLIYTADGHLYKTYSGEQTAEEIGLGVRNVIWDPLGEHLVIGDYEDRITILAKNTFRHVITYFLTSLIDPDVAEVWEEQISNLSNRRYMRVTQPSSPPSHASLLGKQEPTTGISLMEFNSDGTLLAGRTDTSPSTIWIWSMAALKAEAILIHHTTIRSIAWHPTITDMLLIHCALDTPVVHIWRRTWEDPRIVTLSLPKIGGRMETFWLAAGAGEESTVVIGNSSNYTTCLLDAEGQLLPPVIQPADQAPDDRFDQSLTDFTDLRTNRESRHNGQWSISEELDDTFRHKRPARLTA